MTIAEEHDALELLAPLHGADTEELARLHSRLEQAAQREGILDVAYDLHDTPVGTLLLAATRAGLVRVAYVDGGHVDVLATLAAAVSPRILRAPHRLQDVARQLDEYFAGTRTRFDVPLDFRLSHGFRREVLGHLAGIAYGRTESYAQVAQAVGNAKAVRAVGSACATNPLPVVVPCHRVVRSDGTAGGYVGGAQAKRTLLSLESAA
ncbi:methylated-DNA--[protein]-cysteine S-methyltransferase [Parafrigoribacterium mesophilum]|uniref:methylated-DNA--[protein]-cysteine S-methyltransferase n=1 Tax=Parafrigoribacterium mesophilum TaxID=433646 RepID=UPI0031FD4CA2